MQMTISSQAVGAQSEPPVLARILRPALGLMVPVGLAVAWEIIVKLGLSTGRLVPPPSVILSTFADLAATGELQRHATVTLLRAVAGFGFGVVFGTLVGAITGDSGLMYRLIDATMEGLLFIPSIVWVMVLVLWFGIFEKSKIILI